MRGGVRGGRAASPPLEITASAFAVPSVTAALAGNSCPLCGVDTCPAGEPATPGSDPTDSPAALPTASIVGASRMGGRDCSLFSTGPPPAKASSSGDAAPPAPPLRRGTSGRSPPSGELDDSRGRGGVPSTDELGDGHPPAAAWRRPRPAAVAAARTARLPRSPRAKAAAALPLPAPRRPAGGRSAMSSTGGRASGKPTSRRGGWTGEGDGRSRSSPPSSSDFAGRGGVPRAAVPSPPP